MHATESIFLAIFPKSDVLAPIRPRTLAETVSLIGSELTLVARTVGVLELTLTIKLVLFEFADVARVLSCKLEATDAAANPVFPLALVEVAVRPAVNSKAVRLVVVVVAAVDAAVGVHIATKTIFLVVLPEAFVLGPV